MDCDLDHDGVVRWVASQSTNPALQALIKEAERDKHSELACSPSWTPALLPPRSSEPSRSRRANPLSSSTSSINRLRESARPRSSSHSTALSTSNAPTEDEPEAVAFVELLKDVSRQLDENSKKKQKLAVREKERERECSLGRSGFHNGQGPRQLTKTSSASSVWPSASTTRAPERTCSPSMADRKHESRDRGVAKTASLGAPGVDLVSGKSKPSSLPIPNLNYDLKLARPPPRPSDANHSTARKAAIPESFLHDGDSPMQDVIDLTETDTEWESPVSASITRTNVTTYMQVDDEDSDVAMDTSFFVPDPPPRIRVASPKPQPSQLRVARPPAPSMQRARSGPPPLGMRRAVPLQHSQYPSSQTSKTLTVPRFKPPLLANDAMVTSKKTMTTASSRQSRSRSGQVGVAELEQETRDGDSSFDVSFGVDPDALEEAMKPYD